MRDGWITDYRGELDLFKLTILVIVLALIGTPIGCACTRNVVYSRGTRDGVIQKFSEKGLFWKTYEGELALPGFRTRGESTSNTFEFTVRPTGPVSQLGSLPQDTQVRLHYTQYWWVFPWEGSTSYVIESVEVKK